MHIQCHPWSSPIYKKRSTNGNHDSVHLLQPTIPPLAATPAKFQFFAHIQEVAHENKQPTEQQSNDLTKMHDIHVCPSCPYIQPYNTHNSLNRHINTHHLHQQAKTNIELRTDTFRSAEDKKTWQQTLAFLNHLNIKPPPIQINHLLS